MGEVNGIIPPCITPSGLYEHGADKGNHAEEPSLYAHGEGAIAVGGGVGVGGGSGGIEISVGSRTSGRAIRKNSGCSGSRSRHSPWK